MHGVCAKPNFRAIFFPGNIFIESCSRVKIFFRQLLMGCSSSSDGHRTLVCTLAHTLDISGYFCILITVQVFLCFFFSIQIFLQTKEPSCQGISGTFYPNTKIITFLESPLQNTRDVQIWLRSIHKLESWLSSVAFPLKASFTLKKTSIWKYNAPQPFLCYLAIIFQILIANKVFCLIPKAS